MPKITPKTSAQGFVAKASQTKDLAVTVHRYEAGQVHQTEDRLAVEAPLEIRLCSPGEDERILSITLRTPGEDDELAIGMLYGEGVIVRADDLLDVSHTGPAQGTEGLHNRLRVTLRGSSRVPLAELERRGISHAGCGLCGRTHLSAVHHRCAQPLAMRLRVPLAAILGLPAQLRALQQQFAISGGVHAAGLFDANGRILSVREDVGRHNAVDKLIGTQLLSQGLPLNDHGLVLSGRAGFELIQKAVVAGAEVVVALGPPSALAHQLAQDMGLTLLGFASERRVNCYAHPERIVGLLPAAGD